MITDTLSPKEALSKYFGFSQFKGEQEEIIESILGGNHTFVIMPTGGGKSLCYQLPALMKSGTAIVVSPLIALMKNQVDAIRGVSENDGVAHFLNSSLNKADVQMVMSDVKKGVTKLLYMAPESLTKQEYIDFLREADISFFAIDEAHCISEWGHDFRPEYRRLRNIIEEIKYAPIIALTATATDKVQQDIMKNLGMTNANIFKASFNRPNLYYEVRPKKDVAKEIIKFVHSKSGKSGIVYCLSRKKVEEIAEALKVNGIKALPYHAGMEAATRSNHQDAFLNEEVDVIVATIAFGMGIDKPDVRFVIHHDIPKSIESYYQETGRAGRDGGEGHCLAFYSYKDIEKLEKFLQGKHVSEMEIGRQLLQEIVSYAEASMCRRKFILHYFGEFFDADKCDEMCDNCRFPKEKFEGKESVTKVLQTVMESKQRHKARHLINILTGTETSEVKTYKDDELECFGIGQEEDDAYWNAVIRQATIQNLLKKDIETYGTLQLTEAGEKFLAKPRSITLFKENDYTDVDDANEGGGGGKAAADEMLYKMLDGLKKQEASRKNLPAHVIFQDTSLQEMAYQYPTTIEELTRITGVGHGKAKKFGQPFIDLIAKYVDENDIEKPKDLVVKSVVNKSGLKVHIIKNIDRKLPLDDIADAKGKELEDVIVEIEAIVGSGTKINIDYYINDILDEDDQADIYEYFMESESDDLQEAYDEFDGDFTEEQLRLMRIKFMSEVAN
ncbi:MAG: DNA helicase RecQ [Flavobacteriales bacterium]|nr:DNA helicase RecQ [Flavobacteriales bacterium]